MWLNKSKKKKNVYNNKNMNEKHINVQRITEHLQYRKNINYEITTRT